MKRIVLMVGVVTALVVGVTAMSAYAAPGGSAPAIHINPTSRRPALKVVRRNGRNTTGAPQPVLPGAQALTKTYAVTRSGPVTGFLLTAP